MYLTDLIRIRISWLYRAQSKLVVTQHQPSIILIVLVENCFFFFLSSFNQSIAGQLDISYISYHIHARRIHTRHIHTRYIHAHVDDSGIMEQKCNHDSSCWTTHASNCETIIDNKSFEWKANIHCLAIGERIWILFLNWKCRAVTEVTVWRGDSYNMGSSRESIVCLA